jgi:hypothetical protein
MPPVPPQGKQRGGRSNIAVPLHVLKESRAFLFPHLVFLTVAFQRPSPRVLAALGVAVLSAVCPLRPVLAQPSPKVARATRVTRAPRIDGRLDDAMWTAVKPLDDLVQRQPLEGAAPTERSEIYIAYDDEALYIGARLHRVRPQEISRTVTRLPRSCATCSSSSRACAQKGHCPHQKISTAVWPAGAGAAL